MPPFEDMEHVASMGQLDVVSGPSFLDAGSLSPSNHLFLQKHELKLSLRVPLQSSLLTPLP